MTCDFLCIQKCAYDNMTGQKLKITFAKIRAVHRSLRIFILQCFSFMKTVMQTRKARRRFFYFSKFKFFVLQFDKAKLQRTHIDVSKQNTFIHSAYALHTYEKHLIRNAYSIFVTLNHLKIKKY